MKSLTLLNRSIAGSGRAGIRTCCLFTVSMLLFASCLTAPVIEVASAQDVALLQVDVKLVAEGYRVSKMIGAKVLNSTGEKIGTVSDFIIGQDKVLFAILEVGGFLHLGSHLVAVPYSSLTINADGSKIVLTGGSSDELKNLPEFKYKN
jgi:sporulation protein YlmC with PRC-barrel domain